MTTQENGDLQMETEYQDERRAVQKRIFTRWMNVYLNRREPPVEVCDLFRDIQDGRILMILLEELTGCKLLYRFRPSSHRIFRLNNISKALAFLDDRHVKLLGIDASAVADGVPSVVLNLIWNIILHFQVKDLTGGLHRRLSSSLSSLSSDLSEPNPGRAPASGPKYSGKTIKTLLQWVQKSTTQFGVEVLDFGRSWRSGLAFLALIKSINPDVVDMRKSFTRDPQENLDLAFSTAHQSLDIPPLLEPQDVKCSCPDEKSIITYISMFLKHCPDMDEDSSSVLSPPISTYRSLETLVDTEDAQTLLNRFEPSTELLLWKRWSRRSSSGSPSNASQLNKRRSSSVFQPPSPLDAVVVNPDLRSWLDKSMDHGYSKTRADELLFLPSVSSEEGIYSVMPLDSDEEDAYDYILDLNKDVFQTQAKRKVARVEEETAEELMVQSNEELGISWIDEVEVNHSENVSIVGEGIAKEIIVKRNTESSRKTLETFWNNEMDAETKRSLDGKAASNEEYAKIETLDLQYSNLLHLNKDHLQAKRKVPRFEEEIAEEIIVEPNEELKTLEISWKPNEERLGKTLETFRNKELDVETKRSLDGKAASNDENEGIETLEDAEVLQDLQQTNKEVVHLQAKRKVPRVEKEIAEEIIVQPNEEPQILEISWNFQSKVEEAVDDKELKINHIQNVPIVKKEIPMKPNEERLGKTLETFWNNELDAETKTKVDGKKMAGSNASEQQRANFTNIELLKNAEILEEKPFDVQPQHKRGVLIVTEKIAEETHVQPNVKLLHKNFWKTNLDGEEMDLTDGVEDNIANVELLKDAVVKNKKVLEDCQNKNIKVFQTEEPKVKEDADEEIIVQSNEELYGETLETSWNYESEGTAHRNLDLSRESKEIPAKEVSQMDKIQNVELLKLVETESLENQNNDAIAERNLKAPSNNILIAHKRYNEAKNGNNIGDGASEMDILTENLEDFKSLGLRSRSQFKCCVDSGRKMDNSTKICQECTVEHGEKDLHSSDRDSDQMRLRCPVSTVDHLTEHNSTKSSSFKGVILQSVATPSGVSRTELEVLVLLWVFFYCCFITSQLMS